MIIDSHGHLGNILYPGGGELIFRKGVKKRFVVDIATFSEWRTIKTVRKACNGDKALEKLIFHENAARLLDL